MTDGAKLGLKDGILEGLRETDGKCVGWVLGSSDVDGGPDGPMDGNVLCI